VIFTAMWSAGLVLAGQQVGALGGRCTLRSVSGLLASEGLARGVWRVILNVDAENTTGATALYERVGMRVINRWDVWERAQGNTRGS